MPDKIGRRACMKRVSGIIGAGEYIGNALHGGNRAHAAPAENTLTAYFGDLHNHNSVGYGLGSPERAFEIAHSHLDFFCFTPHAYYDTSAQSEMMKNWTGYEKITHDRWPDVLKLVKDYHEPGKFVTFPGYERHSSLVGHYCAIFPDDDAPLEYFGELADFQKHALEKGALLIPHHPGYMENTAGAEPAYWDPRVSPVLEIFSEHGNAECDNAPFDYVRHSMGPRITRHTMQDLLAKEHRFGVVASTDDHLGFPGAYGEGKAVVLAQELTREALFDALRKRRTYGVSGDKILVDFRVNGRVMGEEMPFTGKRTIVANVHGWDWIDRVEILKNNRVIHRDYPADRTAPSTIRNEPMLIRIEYGWGPMAENQIPLDRIPEICDWDFSVSFDGARIDEIQPCWQSAPLAEDRRHRITGATPAGFSLRSYTSRQRCLYNRDTHSIVMKVQGSPRDYLTITTREPEEKTVKLQLSDLLNGDEAFRVKRNSLKVCRIIPGYNSRSSISINDDSSGKQTDWYYLRVIQKNGQLAWSSPIWVEKKG